MKNLKQKPVLYGIVNALGTLIAAVLIWWIYCLISKEPFPDSLLKLPAKNLSRTPCLNCLH